MQLSVENYVSPATNPVAKRHVDEPAKPVAPGTSAVENIDIQGFLREVRELRRELEANLGEADIAHLRRMESWGRTATAIGLATCWICPNPLSIAALSIGRSTRWMMMHHIGHRGYDKVPGIPEKYTSRVFARGARRFLDWNDWMLPEAWMYEHNVLHHANTGEENDPDLVERNTEFLRRSKLPKALRYVLVGALGATWRASYYAPSTLEVLLGRNAPKNPTLAQRLTQKATYARKLLLQCYAPPLLTHLGLLPAMFLPLGPLASASAFVNSLAAEVVTNLHTFFVVGPNHTGDDVYRFEQRATSQGEKQVRQVLGSVNYATGTDAIDFAHLWLNYQIEHHLFPDLPMLKYQEAQPKVRAICEKYGVPYIQEGVGTRFRKMVDVMVGNASMIRA